MPDSRSHRGRAPGDADAFATANEPALRRAVAELSWLLGQGYTPNASLKLVGDRWCLTDRQRQAVLRCAASDEAVGRRRDREVVPVAVRGQELVIDGFNVITTIEAALGGAIVLIGRDGCARDLAGLHGTYRKVEETAGALSICGDALATLGVHPAHWFLDRPVSNSGRLRELLLDIAKAHGQEWCVDLVNDPDPILADSSQVVATADRAILDRCKHWFNLARWILQNRLAHSWQMDLSGGTPGDRP